ncbi:hypothetical protein D3C73_1351100 [compost metagenome]
MNFNMRFWRHNPQIVDIVYATTISNPFYMMDFVFNSSAYPLIWIDQQSQASAHDQEIAESELILK